MNIRLECRVQRNYTVRQQGKVLLELPEEVLEVCTTEQVLEILSNMAEAAPIPVTESGWGRVYDDKAVISDVNVYDYERL